MSHKTHNTYECMITGRIIKTRTLGKARRALKSGQVRLVNRWYNQVFSTSTMEVQKVS